MPTPGEYFSAVSTSATLTEAARRLGVSLAAVSQWRKRRGLEPRRRGAPPRELACAILDDPQVRIPVPEFASLYADLGTRATAVLLGLSDSAVSSRALRHGLRQRMLASVIVHGVNGRAVRQLVDAQTAALVQRVLARAATREQSHGE